METCWFLWSGSYTIAVNKCGWFLNHTAAIFGWSPAGWHLLAALETTTGRACGCNYDFRILHGVRNNSGWFPWMLKRDLMDPNGKGLECPYCLDALHVHKPFVTCQPSMREPKEDQPSDPINDGPHQCAPQVLRSRTAVKFPKRDLTQPAAQRNN